MEILIFSLGFTLLFMGLFLIFFTEKFLSYDSRRLPNFWDAHNKIDIILLNWKSRRAVTLIMGIIFLLGSIVIFLSIYLTSQTKIA